jgi:hypothetical protein
MGSGLFSCHVSRATPIAPRPSRLQPEPGRRPPQPALVPRGHPGRCPRWATATGHSSVGGPASGPRRLAGRPTVPGVRSPHPACVLCSTEPHHPHVARWPRAAHGKVRLTCAHTWPSIVVVGDHADRIVRNRNQPSPSPALLHTRGKEKRE